MNTDLATMNALAIVPRFDTHDHDATGAFQPEAANFVKLFASSSRVANFDNTKPYDGRRADVMAILKAATNIDTVAFLCHGWSSGIQAGFFDQHVDELAAQLCLSLRISDPTVVLYCCSTGATDPGAPPMPVTVGDAGAGKGDNSFADRLRDALCRKGITHCRVMGHSTAAHTTRNPNARFFDGNGSPVGGTGGYSVVSPTTSIWPAWVHRLSTSDLRFRFPYMSIEEIHTELVKPPAGTDPYLAS